MSALAAEAAVVIRSSVPWGGAGSKIAARPAGALRVLAAARPLSTGVLPKGVEMIYISHFRAGR